MSAEIDRFVAERGLVRPPYYRNRTPVLATTCSHRSDGSSSQVNDTLHGGLDLELHDGRSIDDVDAR